MLSHSPQEDFKSRVNAVFGALETSGKPSEGWSVSEKQVFRTGKDTEYSSEEEEEAKREDAKREEILPLLDLNGQEHEGQERPSRAFCRAIDDEQEFDANDSIANGFIEQNQEPKPSQQTQVLDDNVFDRKRQHRQALPCPQLQSINKPAQGTPVEITEVEPNSGDAPRKPPLGKGAQSLDRKPPLPGRASQVASKGRRPSIVPDHVRHPERYTAYELEEGIVVGSGDFGGADRPALSDEDVPANDSAADLPEFGAGIAFQSQKKSTSQSDPSQKQSDPGPAVQARSATLLAASPSYDAQDTAMEEVTAPTEDSVDAPAEFVPKVRRQRNLRSRS